MGKQQNKRIYRLAYRFLSEHLPEGMVASDLEKYFGKKNHHATSLKEVYRQFIYSAQNYQGMPNVIKFEKREKPIKRILFDYDYKKVSQLDTEKLYRTFRKEFKVKSADNHRNSWYKWSRSIVDSARFINGFKNVDDFERFIGVFDYNAETRIALPLLISKRIGGIGFALSCDLLKELGHMNYPKPDVHMIEICSALGIAEDDQISTFESLVKIADDNKVTPYQVDKVLWLICSGNYYLDHDENGKQIYVKSQKAGLIEYLKKNI